ncbi:hypothetical protein KDA_68850 [Dictyobacter alpinus]|uniref:Nucleoside phosphorylase domain-containing protein n=1 Tax=Dictyobacter alpinus TaxID=2014873 RepID=A0A402BJ16_9CHLR|nr:SIR2 family protein [Dictyobacter alpinus]GCE31401.1 hypothetical protein KDA_68850 [Dictyobacter alpinus]
MEPAQILTHLARILSLRRQEQPNQPYHLLLTSTLSLTPQVQRQISSSERWNDFRHYMHQFGRMDRMLTLKILEQSNQHTSGYQSLARLILQGYFSTILTTNIDSHLEQALIQEGLSTHNLQLLIPDRDKDDYIVQELERRDKGIQIVKLHGSLHDQAVPESFPDFFEIRQTLRESIARYLQQDIIIVGSLEQDMDILRALSMYTRQNSTYYVLDHPPAGDDQLVALLEARGKNPDTYTIAGEAITFDSFFNTLEDLLANQDANPRTETVSTTYKIKRPAPIKASSEDRLKADILLVTVTETETLAVLVAVKEQVGTVYQRKFRNNQTYYDLGLINGAQVFLVRSTMGSGGPDGSTLTINEAIGALQPSAVIMVGIAFGLQERKQQIGDILVSQKLRGYEMQRYGTSKDGLQTPVIIPRGDLVPASPMLLDRVESGKLDWPGAPVHSGVILSGEKLVDNKSLRDQLLQLEPEAIGGEMEGEGLYAVAYRNRIHWLLVKAICDWADGNKARGKDKKQKLAAKNAADFILHILQKTRLI